MTEKGDWPDVHLMFCKGEALGGSILEIG